MTDDSKHGRDEWLAIARASDADEVRERILTGFKGGKPFTPYVPTIALPPAARVLDFGCGLGRNFPYLKQVAGHVTGFDLPPMIERCRELGGPVDALSDDWSTLRRSRFDLVFTTLVLQHVEPDVCAAAVADFAVMAPAVYLLTRAVSDFDTNVLEAVIDSEAFDAGPCVEVEHDPATHQLRVLGTMTLEEAARRGSGHYEVVLTSRRFGAG